MVRFDDLRLRDGAPIYLQIMEHLKAGIAAGTVQDGDELPSRRTLSALLGVNPNTIQKACRMLEEQGLLQSRTGAKSYLNAPPAQVAALEIQLRQGAAAALVRQLREMGLGRDEALELVARLWEQAEGEEAE